MIKELDLTYDEYWILWYGSNSLDKFFSSTTEYTFNPSAKIKIDIEKAVEAESKAWKELNFNNSLLQQHGGYRERRLNYNAHQSLNKKLNNE